MTSSGHPIQTLFNRLKGLHYPNGVQPTDQLVQGAAFFPGGCGLWHAEGGSDWPRISPHGLIVLGHNFDSVDHYRKSVQTGGKRLGPTWKNLQTLFDGADIDVANCCLTNFFMGCGSDRTGPFAGSRDAKFIDDCLAILSDTIRLLQPRTLLVLGGHTRRHLGRLAPALAPWQTVRGFADMDKRNLALMEHVHLADLGEFSAVNVVHPSGWTMGRNQSRRRFEGWSSLDAETELVRRAFYGK
jgi:hypothetical protein